MKNNKFVKIHNYIVSILFIVLANRYLFPHDLLGRNTIFNLFFLFLIIYIFNNSKLSNKSKVPYFLGFILSLTLLIGKAIYYTNDLFLMLNSTKKIIIFLASLYSFTIVFGKTIHIIFEKLKQFDTKKIKTLKFFDSKHIFWILWGLFFLFWIPVLLVYYPGILSYDSEWQTLQAMGLNSYTKFHPPIHTFIWSCCLKVGFFTNVNAMLIYALVQMIFLSFCFAKLIKFLIKKKINLYIIIVSIVFLAINPIVSIFSIIMTKDVYFCGFLILFSIELLKMCSSPEKYLKTKSIILFIIYAVLACLFRNNFIYVLIVVFIIIAFKYKKSIGKKIILLAIPIVLYLLITNSLYNLLGVKPGNPKEMLSVPIQQIAIVVNKNNNELNENTKKDIDKFISYQKAFKEYNPRFSDPVKNTFNSEYFMKNKSEFIKLWFKLLINYPNEYISSFLTLNLPYWYFDANAVDLYSKRYYVATLNKRVESYPLERESKIPWLLGKYEKAANYKLFEGVPLISNIFSISLPFWLLLFALFNNFYRKSHNTSLYIFACILLIFTYLLGPVSNLRYIFPLIAMYPLIFAIILNNNKFL